MNYTTARRMHMGLLLVAFPLGAFALMAAAVSVHEAFVLAAVGWTFLVSSVSERIRCPECHRPIGYGRTRLLGLRLEWWKPMPPKSCEYADSPAYQKSDQSKRIGFTRFKRIAAFILISAGTTFCAVSSEGSLFQHHFAMASALIDRAVGPHGFLVGTILLLLGLVVAPKGRLIAAFRSLIDGRS